MPTTAQPAVRLAVEHHLARLTIDNPRRANSLTRGMLGDLRRHLDAVADDPRVRAVVLTGAGRDFCAGLDITGIRAGDPDSIEHEYVGVEAALAGCPTPTIAAVRGHCIGGGTQLAMACDLRIASDTARFSITPAKLGLVYPPDSIERLVAVAGPAAAKRLLFTAEPITAEAALGCGLITDLAADDDLDDAAARTAGLIATRSPVTIAAAKHMIHDAIRHGAVRDAVRDRWASAPNPDLPEGLAAFAAKTAPHFPGRAE